MDDAFAEILSGHHARRGRAALHRLLGALASSVGEFLGASVEITDWTVDPSCADNGADIKVGNCAMLGAASSGVLAFLHHFGEGAWVTVFLLGFDEHGIRDASRAHEVFTIRLSPEGWVADGWVPDGNYAWETYGDDARWQRAPDPPPQINEHPETVSRLQPQIPQLREGLTEE